MAKSNPEQPIHPVVKRGPGYAKLVKAIGQMNTGMVIESQMLPPKPHNRAPRKTRN